MSYRNKDWLENQYITLKKSTTQIGKECNVDTKTISNWLRKFSIKTRTISEAMKGKHRSEEVKRRMSEVHKGKYPSKETREKISKAMKGENHPKWKGDLAKDISKCDRIHNIVRKLKPKTKCCENCGKKTSKLELSFNRFHKDKNPIYYTKNPNDYTYRCRECHNKYDKRLTPNQSLTLEKYR